LTIVLLHAFPLDERMWKPQVEALAGHDVVTPNLYRLGPSMDAWAETVLAAADGPLVVAGASMGGYCALAIARRAPERLAGLLLAGARVEADSPERRESRAETIELIRTEGAAGLWEAMRPKLFPEHASREIVEESRQIVLDQEPDDLVRAIEAIRDRPDSRLVLGSLDVPVVVAVGEHDPFLPREEAPPGRLHVFDGVGHLPSLERAAEFNRLLLELSG
jgi:pimeloyl-ACP methyl ester carboxylesterase